MLTEFISLIRQWIDKAIYVWGGQGEPTNEADIRRRETSTYNADRAIALYRQRQAAGIDPVIKFDCSGLVIWTLQQLGLIDYDTTADGIYRKCAKISKADLRVGDFVFRIDSDGRANHIGIVTRRVDGALWATEARGRDYGVIERPITGDYWERFGRNPFIDTTREVQDVIQKGMTGPIVESWQKTLLSLGFALPMWGADADFGSETEIATKSMQAKYELPQTGIVDAATAAKAFEVLVTKTNNAQTELIGWQASAQSFQAESDKLRAMIRAYVAARDALDGA